MLRFIQVSDAEAAARISRAARFESIPNYPDLHTTDEDLAFYKGEIAQSSGYVAEGDDEYLDCEIVDLPRKCKGRFFLQEIRIFYHRGNQWRQCRKTPRFSLRF